MHPINDDELTALANYLLDRPAREVIPLLRVIDAVAHRDFAAAAVPESTAREAPTKAE